MKKVLYIVPSLKAGGPTNQLINIINGLDKNNWSATVLSLSTDPTDTRTFDLPNVQVKSLYLSKRESFFLTPRVLYETLAEEKPDILHSHGVRADLVCLRLKDRYPCVVTSRNFPFLDYPKKFGVLKGFLLAWAHCFILRRVNVVSCSSTIRDQLLTIGVKSQVIFNGVDTSKFRDQSSPSRANARSQIGLPDNILMFTCVGNLIPRKNVKTVIEGFRKANLKDACLYIIGTGDMDYELRQQSQSCNNIVFTGHQSNVENWLLASDFFISASFAEGLPNSVLEAWAVGIPTLLSDIPSHKEMVQNTVLSKWLFDAHDPEYLAKLIKLAAVTDRAILTSEVTRLVSVRYNSLTMSKQYQKFYEEILNLKA